MKKYCETNRTMSKPTGAARSCACCREIWQGVGKIMKHAGLYLIGLPPPFKGRMGRFASGWQDDRGLSRTGIRGHDPVCPLFAPAQTPRRHGVSGVSTSDGRSHERYSRSRWHCPGWRPSATFRFHIPLASLPGIFQTTINSIPCKVPYLQADPEKVAFWRQELKPRAGFKSASFGRAMPRFTATR